MTHKTGYTDRHGVEHAFGDKAEEQLVRGNDRGYVFHSWSAQDKIDPVPIATAEASRFWDYEGNEYLDFTSQLVFTNLGHQNPDLVKAIQDQAGRLATVAPAYANDVRAELAKMIVERSFDGARSVFFTNGGADANEHAVRMARLHTGRRKVLSMYRSYHGGTSTAISLTGDPRRWANEPSDNSVVHFFGPYLYRTAFNAETEAQETERALAHLENLIQLEGPQTIAAIIIESVVGTNGVLVPPAGYLPGVRALCDKYGIVYIADEVMAGFGRTGEWFAFQAFDVTPDLVTFAKGVNSGVVPLGGVVISKPIHDTFGEKPFPGGLTYSGHPLACAAGVASIEVFERDNILEHVRDLGERVVRPTIEAWVDKHPSLGEVRGSGLFWALELVRDKATREPLVPFNAAGDAAAPMVKVVGAAKSAGVWPFVHFNRLHIAPPLNISEEDLRAGLAGFEAALVAADEFAK